jgi:DNA-binding transcriptional regulator GbsR (MarR family)
MSPLSPARKQFILHWGDLGARWGINRTIAQIHALLHVSPEPLTAEEIGESLSVARSNVSTSVRELQGWGLVKAVPVFGERKQRYESVQEVWEMFRIILDQRKRREIDPTLEVLRLCMAEAKDDPADRYTRERLQELMEFFTEVEILYNDIRSLPLSSLRKVVKARGALRKLVGRKARV